jgi:hypothetical protein
VDGIDLGEWIMDRGAPTPRLRVLIGLVLALLVAACGGNGGLEVGDAAPDFSLSEAAGATVTLEGYRDQAVLLYFHMADG